MQNLNDRCRNFASAALFITSAFGFVAAAVAQTPAPPIRDEQVVKVTGDRTNVEIIEKFVKVVETKRKITRVDGFDPTIVDVTALSVNRIRVQAISQGVTTIVLTDEDGESWLVEVFVKGDARHLQAIVNAKFPDSSVEAFKVRESVVLRGWVTKPENITQIVEIAEQFYPRVLNQMKVGGVQQVKMKVKVMEVQRGKIRNMGINFLYVNRNGFLSSTPGSLTQLSDLTLPFGSGPSVGFNADTIGNSSVAFGLINDSNVFQAFINALKQESLLKILAEPEMVTTNGRPATLLSGGEFPILVPQSLGTTTIEWRPFGVRLEAVPIILGGGRLRLELEPEVSERDFTNAVRLNDLTVPGLTTRRVNTQVEMKFGETLMIAGLIATRQTATTDKIPFFGELPWIGTAFSRKRYDEVETELVVMVTPELVAPLQADQVPPGGPGRFTDTPTDRELFFSQFLEVPKYGEHCEDCYTPDAGMSYPADTGYLNGTTVTPPMPGDLSPIPIVPGTDSGPVVPPVPAAIDDGTPTSASAEPGRRLPFLGRLGSTAKSGLKNAGFQRPRILAGTKQNSRIRQTSSAPNSPSDTQRPSIPLGRRGRPGLIEPKPGIIEPVNP